MCLHHEGRSEGLQWPLQRGEPRDTAVVHRDVPSAHAPARRGENCSLHQGGVLGGRGPTPGCDQGCLLILKVGTKAQACLSFWVRWDHEGRGAFRPVSGGWACPCQGAHHTPL